MSLTFYMSTLKNFVLHSAAKFLSKWKSSIFWRRRNSVAFFICKIWLWTPIEWVVFSNFSRLWNPPSFPQQQSKYSATPPTQQILLPLKFWMVTWPNDKGIQWRGSLGTRLQSTWKNFWLHYHESNWWWPLYMADGQALSYRRLAWSFSVGLKNIGQSKRQELPRQSLGM